MIGSLLYLTSCRHDIMFVVCYCVIFQENPHEPHKMALKNIFRYLRKNTFLALWYPSDSIFFVQAYSDADLGSCGLDQSISVVCQFLDGKLVGWQ